MKASRCSSAPRMQRVWTPRVKDGRLSNDSHQVHYYNKTSQRFSNPIPLNNYNPQNSPAQKKVFAKQVAPQVSQFVEHKLAVQPNKNVKQQVTKNNQAARVVPKNAQKTIQGRNLEFPAEEKHGAHGFKGARPQSSHLQRSSASCSSIHYQDRSLKSSAIKEKQQDFNEKFKVAFGYLMDQNQSYLKQCRRACNQKGRPKEERVQIKRPSITTTAKDQYYAKDTPYAQHMEPLAETVSASFGPRKVCGNSTSKEFHSGKTGPRVDLAEWPDHYKLQGPLYSVTQYENTYPHPGQYQKMIPVATFNEHPRGFAHTANSTHKTFFKGEQTKRADLSTWNNLHPYGNNFDPKRGTTYGNMHNNKQQQPIQQWPMYDPSLIKSEGKFQTEYQGQLTNPSSSQLNEANYCNCGRKNIIH